MLQNHLNKLAATLSLTGSEELTPYLLTKEEEAYHIEYAINRAKSNFMRRLQYLSVREEIMQKVAAINWEEKIDREAVLKQANIAKVQQLWHAQQREKDRREKIEQAKQLTEYWTAKQMFELMKRNSWELFGKKLQVTDNNRQAITALCFFLARDDRFMTDLKLDPQKGLLIRGPTGTGKTHLVRCLATNELNPVMVLSMIDIAGEIKRNGEFVMKPQGRKIVYLDDVGTEQAAVKHYGNTIEWFKDYIETTNLKTKTFNHLIITTNLNFSEMEQMYGFRVGSRLREMFNPVDLVGPDLRRQ